MRKEGSWQAPHLHGLESASGIPFLPPDVIFELAEPTHKQIPDQAEESCNLSIISASRESYAEKSWLVLPDLTLLGRVLARGPVLRSKHSLTLAPTVSLRLTWLPSAPSA